MLDLRTRSLTSRLAATTLLALASTLGACGGGEEAASDPTPAAKTSTKAPEAAELEKIDDTAATAKAASADELPAAELEGQITAIEEGLKEAGFSPSNVGEVGEAKADFVIDTSWAVYVYDSERAAADFVMVMKDIRKDEANYKLFRIENRVYFASMTTALSEEDKSKLDEIAAAAEGAIAAS